MGGHTLGERRRHDSRDLLDTGRPQLCDAAEASQQLLRGARAHPGNVFKTRLNRALCPALAMEPHGEAVGFIADLLDQMEDW